MAEEFQAKLEAVGTKFQAVIETLGKAYASSVVSNGLAPVIQETIEGMGDEVKEAAGKAGEEDETKVEGFAIDTKEKEADSVMIHIEKIAPLKPKIGEEFVVYDVNAVRIGSLAAAGGEKDFYVNAKSYRLRYNQLKKTPVLAKKDNEEAKLTDFPSQYQFAGYNCFCLPRAAGDLGAHTKDIQAWFTEYYKSNNASPSVASHFNIGDDFEVQQSAREVFLEAYGETKDELKLTALKPEPTPFDEGEAVVALLQETAVTEVLPDLVSAIPETPAAGFLKNTANSTVLTGIETAAAGWEPVSVGAKQVGVKLNQKIQESGTKAIGAAFKPILGKIMAVIQKKMEAKAAADPAEEKGDEKEEKAPKIGSISKNWRFNKEPAGKKLYDAVTAGKPGAAIESSSSELSGLLKKGIHTPLEKLGKTVKSVGSSPFGGFAVKKVGALQDKITKVIIAVTTLDGFFAAAKSIAKAVDEVEDSLKESKDRNASIDEASTKLWKALTSSATSLYIAVRKLETVVRQTLGDDVPEEAVDVLLGFLDVIFEVQIRAFNSIRIQYIKNLRAVDAGSDATVTSREAFRDSLFHTANIIGHHHWTSAVKAFQQFANIVVVAGVEADMWPEMSGELAELQAEIPEEYASMGLDIAGLAWTVVQIMVKKAVGLVIPMAFFKIEQAVFTQEAASGDIETTTLAAEPADD